MTLPPAPIKSLIDSAVLDSLDIRLGTIQAIDDVPDSNKLLRLTVSFGDHTRQILVGMKQERPHPDELIGRQALFVVNLPPKRMAGLVSEGMLFDIGYADGAKERSGAPGSPRATEPGSGAEPRLSLTPALAVPERPLPDGTRAG